jgi:hypothetical protein
MKLTKYISGVFAIMVLMMACKKDKSDDLSFIDSASAPKNLSMVFDITQDNTGKVNILPTGEGVSYYEIYFRDTTTIPAKVLPGKSASHIFGEGLFTVKLKAFSASGKSTEFTKELTVNFKAPENLDLVVTKDPENNFKVKVSATALYETSFKIYFGDVDNEDPITFNEGQTVEHTYAKVGTYKMKLVAVSGGAAKTELEKDVKIEDPLVLPLTFESPTLNYTFTNFDGGGVTIIDNPNKSGLNTSNKVGKMIKSAGQPWGGSFINMGSSMNFTDNKIFKMKVFSPRVGAKVLLKVENQATTSTNFEKEVVTTVANAWEELIFDYSAIDATKEYNRIVLIFELGTNGNGSANFTFLFDDISLVKSLGTELPLTFDVTGVDYTFTNFDGGNVTIVDNPSVGASNPSAKVGKMIKGAGQPWGGSVLTLSSPINFSNSKTFKMKVYSPRVGAKVLLKVENATDGGINFEKEVVTTVANGWEDLTFDYSAINTANSYSKVVIIFELGTQGDGSSNFTFHFDDIRLN